MQRMAEDLSQQYDDDTVMYLEQSLLIHWMTASIEYIQWFMLASVDLSITAEEWINHWLSSFVLIGKTNFKIQYGRMFRAYD